MQARVPHFSHNATYASNWTGKRVGWTKVGSKAGGPDGTLLKMTWVAQAHSHTGTQLQTNTQTLRGTDQICYQAAGVGLQEKHIKNGVWMQCIYDGGCK